MDMEAEECKNGKNENSRVVFLCAVSVSNSNYKLMIKIQKENIAFLCMVQRVPFSKFYSLATLSKFVIRDQRERR